MAGQNHCTPPCMVAGYTLPRGICMALVAKVGSRGPRRGSWRGRGTPPWIMAGYARALLSRPNGHLSLISLPHSARGSFFLSLSHTRAPLFSGAPSRRPSPPLPRLGVPLRCVFPTLSFSTVVFPATPRLEKVNFLQPLRFHSLNNINCLFLICLVSLLLRYFV